MASHPPAHCCTTGVKHEGDHAGKIIKIADKWDAYVAEPAPGKSNGAALVYLPDVMGIWTNSQLMADQFAAHGYTCVIPDIFAGDALALNRPPGFDLKAWIAQGSDGKSPHIPATIDPIVEATIAAIKTQLGFKKIGAVGYCFGGKYAVRHYKTGIEVAFLAHPSFVEEDELTAITGPLSIAAAENDKIFSTEKRHLSETLLQKTGKPYQINLFSGVAHGFAVRGNLENKIERFSKDQAFFQAVQWFDAWLL
ncbi:dienelactone hydrolase [Niveomyces insectorum RCEF 264]|uniref:Dienelactone hydrolase n=1 Tax=Niveomyces insectorum RCEF 264 TaxID=1081102 RepID=A0A162J4Q8_9HYPO|nr:dienelactone hydrolase [Niveomyces insectorum RCEF 264]